MREKRLSPNVSIYTSVIDSYAKLNLSSDANRIFQGMDVKPNLHTYTSMIKANMHTQPEVKFTNQWKN